MVDCADLRPALAPAAIEPVVRRLIGEPAAVVPDEWSCHPLAGEGLGTYQVAGTARVRGASVPWALVLKVSAPADRADLWAWDYPAREGLAYGSGLLAALPGGLSAPRFLSHQRQRDGTSWLWLEAVTEAHAGSWPLERYVLAAFHLGSFNGAYLAGEPLPDQPWLSQRWLRVFAEQSEPFVGTLERIAGPSGLAPVRQLYPPAVAGEIERLWTDRERFFTALDGLPRTFCHHDAFRRNLLYRAAPTGEELVALDWAYAGHGAVGEDLAQLVMGSLFFFEVQGITPHEFDATCFTSYMAGLRAAGWAGDEKQVRLGYAAAASLRHTVGLLHLLCPAISDPLQQPAIEELFGNPLGAVVKGWAELWPFQFRLAEEARRLLHTIG